MKFSIRRSKACLNASIFNFARFQDREKKIKCYYYWSHESVCIPHEQIIATNQD